MQQNIQFIYLNNTQELCSVTPEQIEKHQGTLGVWKNIVNIVSSIAGQKELSNFKILVLLVRTKDLFESLTYEQLVGSKYRAIQSQGTPLDLHNGSYAPIITIGVEDIANSFSAASSTYNFVDKITKYLLFDARVKFFDSSIWHRYVPTIANDEQDFNSRFEYVLEKVLEWYRDGLYNSYAAKASLEFQLRMLKNSYISKVGHRGHSNVVTPFKFHSETYMEAKTKQLKASIFDKEFEEGGKTIYSSVEWSFLLVDDQAVDNISPRDKTNTSKAKLIEKILKNDIQTSIESKYPDPVKDIVGWGSHRLSKKIYDVILLDYLLGENDMLPRREYGFDFLANISKAYEESMEDWKRGPLGRFWIYSISSFPYAFSDKLEQLGINPLNPYWHLSYGGDPITTPELFRYKILRFIEQQISESFLTPNALRHLFVHLEAISDEQEWARLAARSLEPFGIKNSFLQSDSTNASEFAKSILDFREKQKRNNEFVKNLKTIFEAASKDKPNYSIIDNAWSNLSYLTDDYEKQLTIVKRKLPNSINSKHYIYISCHGKDQEGKENHLDSLRTQLSPFCRNKKIEFISQKYQLLAGDQKALFVADTINEADLFIVFISAEYLNNPECNIELNQILATKKRFIPIYIRYCDWQEDKRLNKLKIIPAEPVETKSDPDATWIAIVSEIKKCWKEHSP